MRLIVLLLVFLFYVNFMAQCKVDQLFTQWDNDDSPGVAVTIIQDEQVIYEKCFGSANLDYNIPITSSTVFNVASVSKQFTAFAIAILAAEGKLSLNDEIHKYLPGLKKFSGPVTVKQLIYHTSGLPDQWDLLSLAGWEEGDIKTQEHFRKMIENQSGLNYEPGTRFLYVNTGYTLLAEIIERISKKPFSEFMDSLVFRPLGMLNTHFHDDYSAIVKNRACYYMTSEDGYKWMPDNNAIPGPSSLFTTIEDLSKWLINFYSKEIGGEKVHNQILKKCVFNNGEEFEYAFGLGVRSYKGLKTVQHPGGNYGITSFVIHFPDQKFSIAIISNSEDFNAEDTAFKIADIYLKDYFIEEQTQDEKENFKVAPVDSLILKNYTGWYQFRLSSIFKISFIEGKLKVQVNNGTKYDLTAESETKFYVPAFEEYLTFGNSGLNSEIQLDYKGRKGIKVLPFSPSGIQLKEFEGKYFNEQLGTIYSFEVIDGNLIMRHKKKSDIVLLPTVTDQFSGDGRYIQFKRNAQNEIIGFDLATARVWNISFSKLTGQKESGKE